MKHSIERGIAQAGLVLVALLAFAPVAAHATVESDAVKLASCDNGLLTSCTDTGYLNTTPGSATSAFIGSPSVGGALATFTTAFNSWDVANGDGWTLVNGGTLNIGISVAIGVSASNLAGGLSPVIFTLSGGSATLLNQLEWTQALVINYTPLEGSLSTPIETLDTFSLSQNAEDANRYFPKSCVKASSGASPQGGAFCGPIYPFQYGSTLSRTRSTASRSASIPSTTRLKAIGRTRASRRSRCSSTVNASTDTLTVYQGVEYGFSLSASLGSSLLAKELAAAGSPVPEPSTWAMTLGGFLGLGLLRFAARRRTVAFAA